MSGSGSATTRAIKPTHKAIKAYYESLKAFAAQNVEHEMAVRSAFQMLLTDLGRTHKWTFIPEQSRAAGEQENGGTGVPPVRGIRPDGKTSLTVNDSLTLAEIPPEVFEYRLGNRSALEWVIDQYQVSTDKRSGIESDPNPKDDPEYIVRLVGQVVRVSVETVKIVNGLPKSYGSGSDA